MAYAAIYVGRKNYSVCMNAMIAEGFVDKTVGGIAGTVFLASYASGQLINGILGDNISPKKMIPLGLFGAALMNVFMAINPFPALIPIIWGVNGYFCSMLWSPVIRCISEWMSEEDRGSAGTNISITLPVGSICSYVICAAMLKFFNWRIAFTVCAAVLIISALIYIAGINSINSYIKEAETKNLELRKNIKISSGDSNSSAKYSFIGMIFLTGLTFAIGGILFNGILKDGLDLWVPTLITEYFGMSESFSALLTSILPIVNIVGVKIAHYIDKRFFNNEMTTCAAFFAVSVLSFIPLILITTFCAGVSNVFIAIISILLISITSASMLGINTMLLTFIPFHFSIIGKSSGVTGFLNACSYGAAALSGVTIGLIAENYGWNITVIAFSACSALGFIISLVGSGFWKRGREKIKQ